jgi:hypothetical protein
LGESNVSSFLLYFSQKCYKLAKIANYSLKNIDTVWYGVYNFVTLACSFAFAVKASLLAKGRFYMLSTPFSKGTKGLNMDQPMLLGPGHWWGGKNNVPAPTPTPPAKPAK